MSELSPGARDVLERARSAHDPTPADRARVRAAIAATITGAAGAAGAAGATGAAGAGPSAAASGAAGAASVAGSAFPAAKLVVVAVLTGGAAIGGGMALRGGDQVAEPAPALVRPGADAAARGDLTPAPVIDARPAPRESPPATMPDETGLAPAKESIAPRPARPRARASRRAAPDPTTAATTGAAAPAPTAAPSRASAIDPSRSAGADSPPPAGSSGAPASLAAEAALLQRAALALRRGDHAAALSLASQHAARFPGSALDLERDALRAMALCQAGRLAAGSALARRVARRAGSLPLASRVRRSCSIE